MVDLEVVQQAFAFSWKEDIPFVQQAFAFYANTWENMVDPEVVQQAFAFSWKEDIPFSTGLIFANKEAVKRALTIYAAKHNINCMTSRSTKSKLSVKCVDESCKWYYGWSHLMGVLTIVCPLARPLMVE